MMIIRRVMDSLVNLAARAAGSSVGVRTAAASTSASCLPPASTATASASAGPPSPTSSAQVHEPSSSGTATPPASTIVTVASSSSSALRSRKLSREDISHDMVFQWEAIQEDLKSKIIQEDTEDWQRDPELKNLKYIAGLDISYPVGQDSNKIVTSSDGENGEAENSSKANGTENSAAYVAVTVHSYPDMKLVYSDIECLNLYVPYIPGFLAFRESQPLVDAVQKLIAKHPEWTPDVLLVDGNGILHPQQAGLASHVGFHTNLPCIGVSKNIFFFEGIDYRKNMGQNMVKPGDFIYLRDGSENDKILGMALKTTLEAKNPVYVSIGHRISLEAARRVVLACSRYRIPEPIRTADHMSRELIRQHEQAREKEIQNENQNRS